MMDKETIEKSKAHFEDFRQRGIITDGDYDSPSWTITNEVNKGITISFALDELHFIRETAKKLNCTLRDYRQAMRIVTTSRFGFSLEMLQNNAATMRNFADRLELPKDYSQAQLLADLLTLLPGESGYRKLVMQDIDDFSPLQSQRKEQRKLACYRSYLRFADLLDRFWKNATNVQRVSFFPVWFWYKITGVLPLRPTECVLTPRRCIRQEGNRYYLTVRRTRLKGQRQASRYSLDGDYELKEYPIPSKLATPILDYIDRTQDSYESDIDVLFCKTAQFDYLTPTKGNDKHYTYANLRQCLSWFYREIVAGQFGFDIVENQDNLMDHEIEMVHLGDTRHIAMISLAISGGSPVICKELAGHDSINISAHYYSNLVSFLDVLGYERYREQKVTVSTAYGPAVSKQYPIADGYCQSQQVWGGDYSPCSDAVNSDGMPGCCSACKWYLPKKVRLSAAKASVSLELQQTCTLLRQAVDQLRQGIGNADTLSCVLDRLAAQSRQYMNLSSVERMAAESEVL